MAVTINGTTGIITPDIGVDGTTLVVDAVNNRVGIGVANPVRELDVTGQLKATHGSSSMLFQESNNGAYLWLDGADGDFTGGDYFHVAATNNQLMTFGYAGGDKLTLTAAGNIGLGTTSPNSYTNYNTLTINGGNGGEIDFERNGTLSADIFSNSGGFYFSTREASNRPIVWQLHNGSSVGERMRLTGSGQLLVAQTQSESVGGGAQGIQTKSGFSTLRRTNDPFGPYINLGKSRNTTEGQFTVLQDGDICGHIGFCGDDGTDINNACAYINGVIDGTPSANNLPGALTFRTVASGTVSSERMRIDSNGRLGLNQTSINSSRMMEITQPSSYTSALRINTAGSAGNPGYVEWFTGVSNWKLGVDNNNDALIFRRDGTKNVRIDSAGGINIENDVGKFSCGTSADLQIYHDGSNSYINDQGAGGLYIRGGGQIGFRDAENSFANFANFNSAGAIDLYYNGTKKFETHGSGIKVSGRVFIGGSTNGGFDYNPIADTLEVLTTNGSTHSEWTHNAYVPNTNAGKTLGYHNKRWDTLYVNKIAFGGATNTDQHSLDDYEEGFYQPSVYAGFSNVSYGYAAGRYIKIGRLVTADFYIYFTGSTSANGSHIRIGGLPFNVSNDTYGSLGGYSTSTFTRGGGTTSYQDLNVSDGLISFYGGANSNTFYTYKGSTTSWTVSASAVGKYIIGQYIYITD